MAEEARETERLEAVLGPCVRERGVLVEELAQSVCPADGGGFEHVELRTRREQLVDVRLVSPVSTITFSSTLVPRPPLSTFAAADRASVVAGYDGVRAKRVA